MADRVVSVRLQIQVDSARRDAQAAAAAFRGIATAATQAGKSGAALASLSSAAKAVAGIGAVGVGGMVALTASTVKTGISYNTLEQTSRAALKTVLGSAAAATSQMEALREFGKTSPFPRQVWISAQQQLLAFGMAAEKVIPTLSAIQDAVAAAGGSSEQISEVTAILARIQSTGKVTAEELNELGYRGIDAAKLVGEAMGKTAGEVRADITSQAISGQQFLDTLTRSMSEHFAGAAAGVKATWTGAVDRVKGAIRDIGGLLATPLVDPEGGGAAVEWANAVADALRALEARLQPLMTALADRAGPVLDAITAKLEALAEWIRNADFAAIGRQIQTMLPAIVGVTAGLTAMGAKSLPIIGNMVSGLRPLPIALAAAAMASPELRQALIDLLTAAAPLIQAVAQLGTQLAGALGPALSVVASVLQPVIAVVGFLADRFAEMPPIVQMAVAAFVAWKALGVSAWLSPIVTAVRGFNDQLKNTAANAAIYGQQMSTMGAAYSATATRVSTAAVGIRGALTGAASFMAGPWGAAIGLGITALGLFASAQDDAKTSMDDFTVAIDENTGALTGASIESIYKWAAGADTLTNNGAHLKDVLADFGLTANDLTGYLTGNADAISKVNQALTSHDSVAERNSFKSFLDETKNKLDDQVAVQNDAAAAGGRYSSATNDAANASANGAAAAGALTSSLYGVGDASDSVATRTQQLAGIMSGLWDTQFALQKSSDDFQGGLLSLKDAFASNDKSTAKAAGSADKYADSLKRQQKIVRDTQKQLEDLAEAQKQAEEEAAEAAKNARQRALDEMFGKQFDVQSTLDAFRSGLAQAAKDVAEARKDKVTGALSLTGFSEGAMSNRDRMRSLVQQAQAAIQAERDRGASQARINQITASLAGQLGQSAAGWGLNTAEVKQYTDAIKSFGSLASQKVTVDLAKVRKEFAEQRQEIQANSAEQMENARQSAASASQSLATASATKVHTAALTGNSESAIKNRDMMRQLVKQAQDELTQMHLNGASKEQLTKRGEELSDQLMDEATQLGFAKEDVRQYTATIKVSAQEIARYPALNARANVKAAMTTVQNFVKGVNREMAKIQKNFKIGVITGSEFINSGAGGKQFATNADGGYISGPGGPRDDKILSWLSNGEFVQKASAVDYYGPGFMHDLNNKRIPREALPGFSQGGQVGKVDPITLMYRGKFDPNQLKNTFNQLTMALNPLAALASISGGALKWAASQAGKPYIWGGVGPAGYDCSGFQSAITNVIHGRNPYARRFATGSFPTADFAPGPGNYMIGSRRGNPGHMAGTLKGVNVESRGGEGVVVGKRARGAFDSLFGGNVWHLKGYRNGGMVAGDPPFDLLSPLGMHFDKVLGSYAKGTDYVPMDGLYRLHQGERVTPASQNTPGPLVLEVRSDGSKASDFIVDTFNKGVATGRIRVVTK